jgi:hypothetical protein
MSWLAERVSKRRTCNDQHTARLGNGVHVVDPRRRCLGGKSRPCEETRFVRQRPGPPTGPPLRNETAARLFTGQPPSVASVCDLTIETLASTCA